MHASKEGIAERCLIYTTLGSVIRISCIPNIKLQKENDLRLPMIW
uniref:CCH-02 n=1 Tax=Bruguiera gymnorhiza TaxID=39984 RepID=Q4TV07_BRUGY|nr:CCH-02 [Bruguiera gymnorhiza]